MTDHVIIQVRDDLVTRLKAGVTSVEERVYLGHEVPAEEVRAEDSPFVVVTLGDDAAEIVGVNGGVSPSILEDINATYFVHCVAKMDGDAELAAYAVRAEVETTLFSTVDGLQLGGKVVRIVRVAAANNRDEAGDLGAYNVALQIEAKIRHLESAPTTLGY